MNSSKLHLHYKVEKDFWQSIVLFLSLDSILKRRDVTLLTKVHRVKAMVSPVVMYGCESWTIKKAESQRIDAFELWCWIRFLRIPWIARRSNQSILKEMNPEYSLEGLMLKLKFQYFGHLMQGADSVERPWYRRLRATGEGGNRELDSWMAPLTQWTWVWANSGRQWWTGRPGMLQSMGSQRVRHDWATGLNWTEVPRCLSLSGILFLFLHLSIILSWQLYLWKSSHQPPPRHPTALSFPGSPRLLWWPSGHHHLCTPLTPPHAFLHTL